MNYLYLRNELFLIFKSHALCSVARKSNPSLCSVSKLIEKINSVSLHTSSTKSYRFGPAQPRRTTREKPVDWLPFPWQRRPRFNYYDQGGDTIKGVIVDPTLPKPDFELSDELKSANETVKNTFTLATGSKSEAKEVLKRNILKRIQRHPFDFDSLEVKIALKTIQIRALYDHYKDYWKKESRISRFIFPIIIKQRNQLLSMLWRVDDARYKWILEELQLTHTPPKLGFVPDRYCRKWDLRRLTKEYCEKMVEDKKIAYHEQLKKEQEAFLEEKKEILAWIEKEEKELNCHSRV